jgi:hypothetical protein
MNSITTFLAAALVLFALGQAVAAARAVDLPQNVLTATDSVHAIR